MQQPKRLRALLQRYTSSSVDFQDHHVKLREFTFVITQATYQGRSVFLKFPTVGEPHEAITRMGMEREVRVLHQLSHPNIVALDEALQNEVPDYVLAEEHLMDYVTLEEFSSSVLQRQQGLRLEFCSFLASGMMGALRYLHSAGFAHLDLHPENILIRPHDLQWKLVDFQACRTDETLKSLDVGIFRMRAPESILLDPEGVGFEDETWKGQVVVDITRLQACDLWLCGQTLLVTLMHRLPFDLFVFWQSLTPDYTVKLSDPSILELAMANHIPRYNTQHQAFYYGEGKRRMIHMLVFRIFGDMVLERPSCPVPAHLEVMIEKYYQLLETAESYYQYLLKSRRWQSYPPPLLEVPRYTTTQGLLTRLLSHDPQHRDYASEFSSSVLEQGRLSILSRTKGGILSHEKTQVSF